METRTLTLETPDGDMALFEVEPDSPARGAVVVIQEAFGVNNHIQDVAGRFADAGYHAVAPHLFHRTGSPAYGYEDFSVVIPHVLALTDADLLSDVRAALDHLRSRGWTDRQIGIVGFCLGGRVTFLVAGNEDLGAAVGFYGGGVVTERTESMPALLDLVPGMGTPWLGLFGDADGSIPIDDVERLRHELDSAASVDTAIVRYPDAAHGFHCDARDSYDESAATDGWRRTLEWLDGHLEAPSSP